MSIASLVSGLLWYIWGQSDYGEVITGGLAAFSNDWSSDHECTVYQWSSYNLQTCRI